MVHEFPFLDTDKHRQGSRVQGSGFRVQGFRVNEVAIFYIFALSTSATARLHFSKCENRKSPNL